MGFLFGDSTATPFTTNFLEALRDAIDFAAAVAEADERIATVDARKDAFRTAADAEAGRLERLARSILSAVALADKGTDASPTAALATELAHTVSERHHAVAAAVTAKLTEDVRALDAAVAAARNRYRAALDVYLLLREPPDAARVLRLTLVDRGKEDDTYEAELAGESDFGLSYAIELAVPKEGPWSKTVRVDYVKDGLSIMAPQKAGLIKKEVKVKKQKLDRHLVTRLVDDGTHVDLTLRTELGEEVGFDLSANIIERTVKGARIGPASDPSVGAFAIEAEDQAAILDLAEKLRETAQMLARKSVVTATFDGAPFDGNDQDAQPKLVQIVSRLVAKLAPTVNEIAARSRSEDELILRRSLTDGHREEIFLPKGTLREKLGSLDAAHRALFAPLHLEPLAGGAQRFGANEPPTFPTVRSELPQSHSSLPVANEAPSDPWLAAVPAATQEPEPPVDLPPLGEPAVDLAFADAPSVIVAEPSVIVAEPAVVVAEPSVIVAEPPVIVAEPSVIVAEPPVIAAQPAVVAEPSVVVAEPAPVAAESVPVLLPKPVSPPRPAGPPRPSSSLRPAVPKAPVTLPGIVAEPEPPKLEIEEAPNSRNEALVATLKEIRAMSRDGRIEESYRQFAVLFTSPVFAKTRAEDRRQALKLMIHAKLPPTITDEIRDAHRSATSALQLLVMEQHDPADYEMLGMAYVILDEPAKGSEMFKKALDIERTRNPSSDLCGNLMRRVSQL